jgi:hypothetical protein
MGEPPQPLSPHPIRPLSPEHSAHLATSGLTANTLASAGLYTITARDEICRLLRRDYALPHGACIVFPFCEPGVVEPYGYRLRPDHPRLATQKDPPKPVKYDQPADVGILVYFPPSSRVRGYSLDPTATLYWCEGEKKALALDQEGYLTIGLTGVWNWVDPELRRSTSAFGLNPRILRHVPIEGRAHVIVFDRDARANAGVMNAARKLAGVLIALGAASVAFVCPPDTFEGKGIDDYLAARGAAELHTLLAIEAYPLDPRDPSERGASPLNTHPYLTGASGLDGLALPQGYELSETGALMVHGPKRVQEALARVLFIRGRYEDIASGEHWAEVAYRNQRGWVSHTIPRRMLVDQRAIVGSLGSLGAPITSHNSRAAVEWFGAFELANEVALSPRKLATRCGWHGSIFVSHQGIGVAPGELTVGGDLGEVVRALTPRGDLEEHLAALREAWAASPVVRILICGALAVPMLERLGAANFALHLCGDSSRGKTTMLRVVASVYGDPWAGAWVGSWNTTANAAEIRAQLLCDLPLIYDELGVSTLETVQRLIYSLVNGEGKIRLNRDSSARKVHRWRTGVLSSGEVPLGDESLATGAQARVVNIEVDGWGSLDNQRSAIDGLVGRCRDHAGSFGHQWLTQLVGLSPEDWHHLRVRLSQLNLDEGKLSGRLAAQSALFHLVAQLLHANWGFEQLPLMGGEDGIDRAEVVSSGDYMRRVLGDWVSANPLAFPRADVMTRGAFRVRAGSWSHVRYGVLVFDGEQVVETLFLRTEIARLFKHHNRVLASVLKGWAAAGLIEVQPEEGRQRFTVKRSEAGVGRSHYVAWRGLVSDWEGE